MKKQPSLSQLKRLLAEAAFDPRSPGPMKVIVDISSVDYLLNRSVEFISEAIAAKKRVANYCSNGPELGVRVPGEVARFHECIRLATGLLALARAKSDGPVACQKD